MFWLKLLGRVINALNKGADPWQIAGGLVLGFWLGLIPGWPVQCFVLLLVLFVVNVNLTIAGVGAVLASMLAWIFDPVVDALGGWVLEGVPALKGMFTAWYNYPPMGMTRFNNTVVMGATLLGLVGAVVWYPILIWAVKRYRETVLVWVQKLWITRVITGSKVFQILHRITSLGMSR